MRLQTGSLRSLAGEGSSDQEVMGPGLAEAAHKVQESLDSSTATVADSEKEAAERRHRVRDLFHAMDKDGNGKLDVGEFRGKRCSCSRALSQAVIFQKMDVQQHAGK